MNLQEILAPIHSKLVETEKFIHKKFEKDHILIKNIGQFTLSNGGKRLRPTIMILSSLYFGKYNQDTQKLACALEYIHTASLIHDDVVDNADYRRNQKTVHQIWGNRSAILVGDYILAKAFEQLANLQNLELVQLISRAVLLITKGEILQMLHKLDSVETKKYLKIIHHKTACLIGAAMQSGAAISNQEKKIQAELYRCGEYLGMAFQITDDILDYQGALSGKTIGKDFYEKKITLPLCKLLQIAKNPDKNTIKKLFLQKKPKGDELARTIFLMQSYKIFELCLEDAKKYQQKAKKILLLFAPNIYQQKLIELADFIIKRTN